MNNVLIQSLSLFNKKEKVRFAWMLLVALSMAFFQVAGIGSMMPFLGVLSNIDDIGRNASLMEIYDFLGFSEFRWFLLTLGGLAFFGFLTSSIVSALGVLFMARFAWSVQARLSVDLLQAYLDRPYEQFAQANTADLRKNILTETVQFATGILLPMLNTIAFGTVVLFILVFLIWIDPKVATIAFATLAGGYVMVFWAIRGLLIKLGEGRMASATVRFKYVDEAFGSAKESRVLGRQEEFISRFKGPSREFSTSMALSQAVREVPRYVIESLAFGSVLLIVLVMVAAERNLPDLVATIGLFAYSGYRVLNALNNVYRGIGQARFNRPVVEVLMRDLKSSNTALLDAKDAVSEPAIVHVSHSLDVTGSKDVGKERDELSFNRDIDISHVTYSYPGMHEPALNDINLHLKRGEFVGIVGKTGAGKTTLLDTILGLLLPQSGNLSVDGTVITSTNMRRWQNLIGYVPQDVYLTDESISSNIALGVPPCDIDLEAIRRAATIANIDNFVVNELRDGYSTIVGERGVRLSAGQRQRIGIARALYHNPSLLIFDEATSNLDQATESSVYAAIQALVSDKTIIMIAHRLSVVRNCDTLHLMDGGTIVAAGTYNHLLANNIEFRSMVNA